MIFNKKCENCEWDEDVIMYKWSCWWSKTWIKSFLVRYLGLWLVRMVTSLIYVCHASSSSTSSLYINTGPNSGPVPIHLYYKLTIFHLFLDILSFSSPTPAQIKFYMDYTFFCSLGPIIQSLSLFITSHFGLQKLR